MTIQFTDVLPLLGVLFGGGISLATTILVSNKNMKNNMVLTNTQNRREIYVKLVNLLTWFLTMRTDMEISITYPTDPNTGNDVEDKGEDTICFKIKGIINHWEEIAGEAHLYLPHITVEEIKKYIRFLRVIEAEIRQNLMYKPNQLILIKDATTKLLGNLRKDIGIRD